MRKSNPCIILKVKVGSKSKCLNNKGIMSYRINENWDCCLSFLKFDINGKIKKILEYEHQKLRKLTNKDLFAAIYSKLP